jgi:hypothetical protein
MQAKSFMMKISACVGPGFGGNHVEFHTSSATPVSWSVTLICFPTLLRMTLEIFVTNNTHL